jgi:hypothetical protein
MILAKLFSSLTRLALGLLTLSVSATCSRNDSSSTNPGDVKIRKALIGTWVRPTNSSSGALTLSSDGTFKSGWTNVASEPIRSWRYEGYWSVTGGVCVAAETRSESIGTTNKMPPSTNSWRIINVDAERLVWELNGETNTLTRKR